MARRVVVTGMGGICATGANVAEFWANSRNGACGIVERTVGPSDDLSVTTPMAPVDGFEARAADLGRDAQRADRFTQFAIAAAEEALANSGAAIDDALSARTAAIIGTGIGGQKTSDESYYAMMRQGRRPHPLSILKVIANAPASHLAIRFGARGPAFAVSSACASGAHAIGVCADLIRSGAADQGFAGAAEAVLTYGALNSWKVMHIMSDELCRPFSKNRKGLVIGEGAGVLFLEEYERAKARGAQIHAEIVGFGMNADGKDMINPDVKGAAAAIRLALTNVRVADPAGVYINAHGTGTLLNDPTETKAIREVFGADADALIVSSTKSMHGHLLGAAGGIEAIAAIMALKEGIAPPTINYDEPDPACDLDYAPNEAKERKFDLALSNSFAFGGLNAVLAFAKV
ncbi:MAG TPA: beta-ketoacyl-[acyl-carrier-protein] synthase family protein [Parvularculaceae bacterium]|nr:beta-ketoacyl-[acyl-carrier-protein] synthase family protein [Parvularculaceae bacterium]